MTCPDINPEQNNEFSDNNMLTFDKKEEKVNIIVTTRFEQILFLTEI